MSVDWFEDESCAKLLLFILCHSLRDRLKKLTAEKDTLESQLKNEKDERDLYKVGEKLCVAERLDKKVHLD